MKLEIIISQWGTHLIGKLHIQPMGLETQIPVFQKKKKKNLIDILFQAKVLPHWKEKKKC